MWTSDFNLLEISPSAKIANWLLKPYKLSEDMRKVSHRLHLEVLRQDMDDAHSNEVGILGLQDDTQCLVRMIVLRGDEVPFSFARVVVPKKVYINHQAPFDTLGSKLIGETFLYQQPTTIRLPFEYGIICQKDPLYQTITKHIMLSQQKFWGRRSIFLLSENEPILISEFFFDSIPDYPLPT